MNTNHRRSSRPGNIVLNVLLVLSVLFTSSIGTPKVRAGGGVEPASSNGPASAGDQSALSRPPTRTRRPTATRTLTRTPTRTRTGTRTNTPTATATFTASVTDTPTETPTDTSTLTPTASNTPTVSRTRTLTITRTYSPIPSLTSTRTSSSTPTASRTPVPTLTSTPSASQTSTATESLTPTPTPTLTVTRTASLTVTRTASPTSTPTISLTSLPPNLVVNNADSGPGSLRDVIALANPGDVVRFDPSLAGQTIVLESSLTLNRYVTIDGGGLSPHVQISGNNLVRVFWVEPGVTASLIDLDIVAGYVSSLSEGGGALYNAGVLWIAHCRFSQNQVGLEFYGESAGGGAIYNLGSLTVFDSTFDGNTADHGGAIFNQSGLLDINSSTFTANSIPPGDRYGNYHGWGGAVLAVDPFLLSISNSQFDGNSTPIFGGAVAALFSEASSEARVDISASTFNNNSAAMEAAAILVMNGSLTLTDSTLAGNRGDLMFGALLVTGNDALVANSHFYGNHGLDGAAIYYTSSWPEGQTFTLRNSTFEENSASQGGIVTMDSGIGFIEANTFAYNTLSAFLGLGGEAHLSNNTFHANDNAVRLGSYDLGPGPMAFLTSNTVSANDSGIVNWGTLSFSNNIAAGNTSADCVNFGVIEAHLSNLIENPLAPDYEEYPCPAELTGDPLLGPLSNNGGPTRTLALLAGSPAIDAGDDASCPEFDQRGILRPQGAHCDVGAFEYVAPPSTSTPTPTATPTPTPTPVLSIVVTNNLDSGPGSLRDVLTLAGPGDTILFDPSLAGGTILLQSTLLLDKPLTIDGSGLAPRVQISGGDAVRIFQVAGGVVVSLEELDFIDGYAESMSEGGGAIFSEGTLSVANCSFSHNLVGYVFYGEGAGGGAIFSTGDLSVAGSSFADNTADHGAAIFVQSGSLQIEDSTFTENMMLADSYYGLYGGQGGAVLAVDPAGMSVARSSFSGNLAQSGSALAIHSSSGASMPIEITDSSFDGNISTVIGGAIYSASAPVIVANDSFTGNTGLGAAVAVGGADLLIIHSIFTANGGENQGPAVILDSNPNATAYLMVRDSTFENNVGGEGAIDVYSAQASIQGSTFAFNDLVGVRSFGADLDLRNNTFYGNQIAVWEQVLEGAAPRAVDLTNNTFWDNNIGIINEGTLNFSNNIVAGSGYADCWSKGIIGIDLSNLSTNVVPPEGEVPEGSACPVSIVADPLLGDLADNGGVTLTLALLDGSPAIDAGDDSACLEFDQRGVSRPQGAHCDVGAFEYVAPPVDQTPTPTNTLPPSPTPTSTPTPTFTATFTPTPSMRIVVTNNADSGPGSLRQAILDIGSGGTITFDPSLAGQTLNLTTWLPIEKNLTVDGSGLSERFEISGNATSRIFYIYTGYSVSLESLVLKDAVSRGTAYPYYGAALYAGSYSQLNVRDVAFRGNAADTGGAVYLGAFASVSILNSEFTQNSALTGNGGAISVDGPVDLTLSASVFVENGAANFGGAIEMFAGGTRLLENNTFTGNYAASGGAMKIVQSPQTYVALRGNLFSENAATSTAGGGGALYIYPESSSLMSLENNTFYANQAVAYGGAVYASGTADLRNNTFSDNQASANGGSLYVYGPATITLDNNVLANSQMGGECAQQGTVTVTGHNNLVEDGSTACLPAFIGDPLLGPLADNGGPTWTMALLDGSPAIENGDGAYCPATDARGVTRPQGLYCDIGAFEYEWQTPAPTPTVSNTPSNTPTPSATRTATYTRTPTYTRSPTLSRTPSRTPTISNTPTLSVTRTPSRTPTRTPTATFTSTPTDSATPSPSETPTLALDCSAYTFDDWAQGLWDSDTRPTVLIHLTDSGPDDVGISQLEFYWDNYDYSDPEQALERIRVDDVVAAFANDADSPTTVLFDQALELPAGATLALNFDFGVPNPAWPGIVPAESFGLVVTLEDGCTAVKYGLLEPWPITPTLTPTPGPMGSAPLILFQLEPRFRLPR